jgi:integrase
VARKIELLTPLFVKRAGPGLHADGGGLYLQVKKSKNEKNSFNRSWIFRFRSGAKLRDMGLGPVRDVGLAEARRYAQALRQTRRDGVDPIEVRRQKKAQATIATVSSVTFWDCAKQYLFTHDATWDRVHARQWRQTLEHYAKPVIGSLPVAAVNTALVCRILQPIWSTKTETASRLRGRIEKILDWAKTREYRDGENPARWRGHLENLLPTPTKIARVKHHAAMPYAELPAFMARLREFPSIGARALEFAILTAARTDEVLDARRDEFDLFAKIWTVPAERMKAKKEHRVPLCHRAVTILDDMHNSESDYAFAGRLRAHLGDSALDGCLHNSLKIPRSVATVHGFRATFRTWVGDCTNFPDKIAEIALAHIVGSQTERAYERGDQFEKRRRLMDAWAEFCAKPVADIVGGKVVSLRS